MSQLEPPRRLSLSGRKKIVHLSSVHRATDTRILHKECRSLVAAGFDVTLIAIADEDVSIGGVEILALKQRSGNRLVRMTKTVSEVFSRAREANGDAYHLHDPELIPMGVLLKLLGKRVVFDSHEHVSKQISSKYWVPTVLRTPITFAYSILERVSTRMFDGIVAATPGIAASFSKTKTVIVQNFALLTEFECAEHEDYHSRALATAYIGAVTKARGLCEMVQAMEVVCESIPEARLQLAGSFVPTSLEREIANIAGWSCVEFLGWLSRSEVVATLNRSRVGLLVLHPEPNYIDSYPVKLFEYMLAGLPVVASNFPFWRQFVEETGSGLMINPSDPQAIAEAIQWLLEHPNEAQAMGKRGREAAVARYTWESEADKLVRFYHSMVFGEHI